MLMTASFRCNQRCQVIPMHSQNNKKISVQLKHTHVQQLILFQWHNTEAHHLPGQQGKDTSRTKLITNASKGVPGKFYQLHGKPIVGPMEHQAATANLLDCLTGDCKRMPPLGVQLKPAPFK